MTFFRFKGRANRGEYFLHHVLEFLLYMGFIVGSFIIIDDPSSPQWVKSTFAILFLTALVVIIIDEISVTVRRLHDIDRPSSHYWLGFIPLYNIYLGLLLLFKAGTPGPNRFDGDPVMWQLPPVPTASPEEYECSRCGGAITWGETFCKHCGDTLEYD